jgi:hypothetical protein
MARYVRRDGRLVERSTGEPLLTDEQRAAPITCPMIMSDIPEYASPIDGRMITSRSERREDLLRNNCVEAGDMKSPTGGKIRNKAFAAKRGLKVSEEFL